MTEAAPSQDILSPEALAPAVELAEQALTELDTMLLGQPELHRLVLIGILSRGHMLLEGLPGVGKTALIRALGQLFQLEFKRVQFTPDLMPGDILGTTILEENAEGGRRMAFKPGPVFTNLLLADEINRASPKTQAALLEAMQERRVTTLGRTRDLPAPFFVLASQNPIELEGTYPLPEAQLDRFMFKLEVSAVGPEVLRELITHRRRGETPAPGTPLPAEALEKLFTVMEKVLLPGPVAHYIARLVAATHPGGGEAPEPVRRYVRYGASPRGAIAMAEAARGQALLAGRPTVGFEDVKHIAPAVLAHRVILNHQARFDQLEAGAVVGELLEHLEPAPLDLPADIEVRGAGA